jgi:hypothetical protein
VLAFSVRSMYQAFVIGIAPVNFLEISVVLILLSATVTRDAYLYYVQLVLLAARLSQDSMPRGFVTATSRSPLSAEWVRFKDFIMHEYCSDLPYNYFYTNTGIFVKVDPLLMN